MKNKLISWFLNSRGTNYMLNEGSIEKEDKFIEINSSQNRLFIEKN
jgi:hypothetical protein